MSTPSEKMLMLKKVFTSHHGLVYAHTDICTAWSRHHLNCVGCRHEKQCRKFACWVASVAAGHSPDKFLDDPEAFSKQ